MPIRETSRETVEALQPMGEAQPSEEELELVSFHFEEMELILRRWRSLLMLLLRPRCSPLALSASFFLQVMLLQVWLEFYLLHLEDQPQEMVEMLTTELTDRK